MPEGYDYLCEADLAPGQMRRLSLGEFGICLANVEGRYHAIEDACNHSGASLAKGTLVGPVVTCYLHSFEFDLRDGRLLTQPRLCDDQKCYPVAQVGTSLFIERRNR